MFVSSYQQPMNVAEGEYEQDRTYLQGVWITISYNDRTQQWSKLKKTAETNINLEGIQSIYYNKICRNIAAVSYC